MSKKNIPIDKERLLNSCMCGCSKNYQVLFDKIEQYKESEPEMVKYLQWYLDDLWKRQVKTDHFHQMRMDEKLLIEDTVVALRAMADKLEQDGDHFIIGCDLPQVPIFSGSDRIEKYSAHIEVTIVSGPLGG